MPKILIADDSAMIRRLLRFQLESMSPEILETADGQAALDLARAAHPAIAVLDCEMPRLNGLEVCRQLKAEPATRDMTVHILTGSDPHGVEGYAMTAGADGFFTKPRGTRAVCQQITARVSR